MKARSLGPVLVAPKGDPVVRLGDGDIEVFSGWLGMDLDASIDDAAIMESLPCAQLEDVRTVKHALRRPKDLSMSCLSRSTCAVVPRNKGSRTNRLMGWF